MSGVAPSDAANPETPADEYAPVYARISRLMLHAAALAIGLAWGWLGWRMALSIALGAAVGYFNFFLLKRSVFKLGERIVSAGNDPGVLHHIPAPHQQPTEAATPHTGEDTTSAPPRPGESGARIVAGFFFRYILLGAAAYAIFKGSALSLVGLFAGLLLPVAALMGEAAYQLFLALRHRE